MTLRGLFSASLWNSSSLVLCLLMTCMISAAGFIAKVRCWSTMVVSSCEMALQQNEIMDIFYDDYDKLPSEEGSFGSKSDTAMKVSLIGLAVSAIRQRVHSYQFLTLAKSKMCFKTWKPWFRTVQQQGFCYSWRFPSWPLAFSLLCLHLLRWCCPRTQSEKEKTVGKVVWKTWGTVFFKQTGSYSPTEDTVHLVGNPCDVRPLLHVFCYRAPIQYHVFLVCLHPLGDLKEYQSFTDLRYSKDKTSTCVRWHPAVRGKTSWLFAIGEDSTSSSVPSLLPKIDRLYPLFVSITSGSAKRPCTAELHSSKPWCFRNLGYRKGQLLYVLSMCATERVEKVQ